MYFLKNTKNIYAFWDVQKSCFCWVSDPPGTPTPPPDKKKILEVSK